MYKDAKRNEQNFNVQYFSKCETCNNDFIIKICKNSKFEYVHFLSNIMITIDS